MAGNIQALKPHPYPSLKSIDDYHRSVREIIKQYFNQVLKGEIIASDTDIFVGARPEEIERIKRELLDEEEKRSCFALLAYIEATFKAHFLYVVDTGVKCKLQKTFRKLFNAKRLKMNIPNSPEIVSCISLKFDILERWKRCGEIDKQYYDDIVGAFNFRNWFAHGRFLTLQTSPVGGVRYQYDDLYLLAQKAESLCALAKPYLS